MKTKFKGEPKIENNSEYPVLMESLKNGEVVMFFGENSGVRLKCCKDWTAEENFSYEWKSIYDESVWKKYEGSVTIQND